MFFVTGLPRSGTKLLRDLLNNHSRISIPIIETVLIPYFLKKYGISYNLNDYKNRKKVFKDFENSTFYWNYKRMGIILDTENHFKKIKNLDWRIFFNEIILYYGPKKKNENLIIGDKTPGYINHFELLKEIWPQAKLIHIIRDPRDYALSVKKTWGRNIYRAAYRWSLTMASIHRNNFSKRDDYIEIYFEDLLNNASETLKKICDFLLIDYESNMSELLNSSENYGDAKGQVKIVSENKNKFKTKLSKKQLLKIESILLDSMVLHDYKPVNEKLIPQNLTLIELFNYKIIDGVNSLTFNIKDKGVINGIVYFFKLHKRNIK